MHQGHDTTLHTHTHTPLNSAQHANASPTRQITAEQQPPEQPQAMGRSRSRDRYDSRKRSRSRSPERRRRSRSRERRGWGDPDPAAQAQLQALAAAQLQQQMLAQQQALMAAAVAPSISVTPQAAALVAAAAAGGATLASATTTIDTSAARKSREIYIGNLAIGSVTPEMLQELFNAALAGMVPDPVAEPPVLCVKLDPTVGRFAFVEFRTEELATTAMTLDKTELLGRTMNIGRPKGYIPGASAPAANDTLAAAQQVAAALLGGVTNVVLLEGFMDAATIRATDERQEVSEMVYEESVRCGKVLGIAVPLPPPEVPDADSARVYIKFSSSSEAAKCKEMMDGRLFDEAKVKCTHVTEADYKRAAAGEWVKPGALPPVPASVQPLAGIPGLGGLPAFVPGLPGQAPLSIPSMLPPPGSAASHKPAYGGIPGLGAFPPPPP